jgi:hypothetical protein
MIKKLLKSLSSHFKFHDFKILNLCLTYGIIKGVMQFDEQARDYSSKAQVMNAVISPIPAPLQPAIFPPGFMDTKDSFMSFMSGNCTGLDSLHK